LFLQELARLANTTPESILDFDISFFDSNPVKKIGTKRDLIAGSRLSSIGIAFCGLSAFISSAPPSSGLNGFVVFDGPLGLRQERTSAGGNFLSSVVERIGCTSRFFPKTIFLTGECSDAQDPLHSPKSDTIEAVLGKGPSCIGGAVSFQTQAYARYWGLAAGCQPQIYSNPCDGISGAMSGKGMAVTTVGVPILSRLSVREIGSVSDFESIVKLYRQSFTR
jgi:aspartyl aminopeptidase